MQKINKDGKEIDRKDIIKNTIWVRWIFVIALIPLIVFLAPSIVAL